MNIYYNNYQIKKGYTKMEKVKTSSAEKQIFRSLMEKSLNANDCDDNLWRQKICIHLMSNKEINTLKKDFSKESYEKLIRKFNMFAKSYSLCEFYRKSMAENAKNKQILDLFDTKLKEECSKIAAINPYLIVIFMDLLLNCDLKDLAIRVATVKNPHDNKMSFMNQETDNMDEDSINISEED
jgi:hypothetical protein